MLCGGRQYRDIGNVTHLENHSRRGQQYRASTTDGDNRYLAGYVQLRSGPAIEAWWYFYFHDVGLPVTKARENVSKSAARFTPQVVVDMVCKPSRR